jgi:hypothetical protein
MKKSMKKASAIQKREKDNLKKIIQLTESVFGEDHS